MKQQTLELFEENWRDTHDLPKIYVFENLNINQKINYRSAPCNLYGDSDHNISEVCYRDDFKYGLDRGCLDYSLAPSPDHRKDIVHSAPFK